MSQSLNPNAYGVIPLQPKPGGNVDTKPFTIDELAITIDPDVRAALKDYTDTAFLPEPLLPGGQREMVLAGWARTPEGWLMIGTVRGGYPCDVNQNLDCDTYGYFIPLVSGTMYVTTAFVKDNGDIVEYFYKIKSVEIVNNLKRVTDIEPLGLAHNWAFIGEPQRENLPRLAVIPGNIVLMGVELSNAARWLLLGLGAVAALKIADAIYRWSEAQRITAQALNKFTGEFVKLLEWGKQQVRQGNMSPQDYMKIIEQGASYLKELQLNTQKGTSITDKIKGAFESLGGTIMTIISETFKMVVLIEVIRTLMGRR